MTKIPRPLVVIFAALMGSGWGVAPVAWSAALTWVGTGADSDFNTSSNWSPAQTPTTSDTCSITGTSSRQPSILSNASCGSLTLGTGGTLMTLTLAANNLTITGNVTIGANGRVTPTGVSSGVFTVGGNWSDDVGTTNFTSANIHHQVTFNGASKTLSSNETFYHIQISGSLALASNLTIAQTLAIGNTHTLTQGAYTLTHNGTLFSIAGTYSHTCASTLVVNASLNMDNAVHYPNVVINSGGTLLGASAAWIDCDLTVQAGGTFNINTPIYVSGDWVNNGGTLICSTGTIIMNGSGKRLRGSAAGTWFHHLTIGDGGADSVTAEIDVEVAADLTVAAGATFTLQAGKNIALTGSSATIAGTMDLSGTSTWTQVGGNNVGIHVVAGGLLRALGTDATNRVTFTRSGGSYYELVVDGGIHLNQVNIDYTESAAPSAGFAVNSPAGATVILDYVSFRNTENINNAVMMVWNANRTATATGVTFDSSTYAPGNTDVNVEARQGTITFSGYGGNYAGEALDNDNGGTAIWTLWSLSGRVFEDGNFAGTAIDWDGGVADLGLANVDVELYTAANVYQASVTTGAGGTFSFTNLSNGTYKVRARSVTIGDANTPPQGTFRPCVPASCAYPLPEMTWAGGAALYGGQSVTVDDTTTGDNAGPGDTYASVTIASANAANINLGFAYNLIVNADDDAVVVTSRSQQGSLRQFIKNANAIGTSGGTTANSSRFRIGSGCDGSGVCTINATGAFPPLSDTGGGTMIDGYTQPLASANTVAAPAASNASLKVVINGDASGTANLLTVNSSNNTIRGLVINGGFNIAIAISGSVSGNVAAGNYIGTNASGMAASATKTNLAFYVAGGANNNTIGGGAPQDRNLLSGTASNTIWLLDPTTQGNTIRGNFVGTDVTGAAAIPNPNAIVLTNGTHDNTIQGNVISGNSTGIWIDGGISDPYSNVIVGNKIGTTASGTTALANTVIGVQLLLGAHDNRIGGTIASERNLVSGNTVSGIQMTDMGTSNNVVEGNDIGVNAAGAGAIPNGTGVEITNGASANVIGGETAAERNVIAGNLSYGVYVSGDANDVSRNFIGALSTGGPLGNANSGVVVTGGANNLVRRNLIRDSGGHGIHLAGTIPAVRLYQNTIYASGGYGVLVDGSVTTNDFDIRNNILSNNPFGGINSPAVGTIAYNDYFNNAGGACTGGCGIGAGSLTVDPLWGNPAAGDFTPTVCTSPVINAGVDLAPNQPDMNGLGTGLFNGLAPDMGAFETSCSGGMTLVKQVWQAGGTNPLATTNDTPTSAIVPAGSTVVFLIYVKNSSGAAFPDVRFLDLLDDSAGGFDYVPGSMVRTSAGSPPVDTASDLAIFMATALGTGTALGDAVDADVASVCEAGAASCPGALLNRVTVGGTTGLSPSQANATLSIAANSTFAIRFQAVKK